MCLSLSHLSTQTQGAQPLQTFSPVCLCVWTGHWLGSVPVSLTLFQTGRDRVTCSANHFRCHTASQPHQHAHASVKLETWTGPDRTEPNLAGPDPVQTSPRQPETRDTRALIKIKYPCLSHLKGAGLRPPLALVCPNSDLCWEEAATSHSVSSIGPSS